MITATVKFQATRKPAASQISRLQPARASLLQRKCACGGTHGLTGECEECARKKRLQQKSGNPKPEIRNEFPVPPTVHGVLQPPRRPLDSARRAIIEPHLRHDFSRLRVHFDAIANRAQIPVLALDRAEGSQRSYPLVPTSLPGTVHAKLVVGKVDDPLEQEADRTADRVVAITPEADLSAARPDGGPMPTNVLDHFERALLHDLSSVRVHADAEAADAACAVGARAYTAGSDIVFGSGEYRPSTTEGRRLLAHELAHVIQQPGNHTQPTSPVAIQRQVEEGPEEEETENDEEKLGEGEQPRRSPRDDPDYDPLDPGPQLLPEQPLKRTEEPKPEPEDLDTSPEDDEGRADEPDPMVPYDQLEPEEYDEDDDDGIGPRRKPARRKGTRNESDEDDKDIKRQRQAERETERGSKAAQTFDPQDMDRLENGYVEFASGDRPSPAYSSVNAALAGIRGAHPNARLGDAAPATGNDFRVAGPHQGVWEGGVYVGTIFEGQVLDSATNQVMTVYTYALK